jgi:phosphoserine aminotransferase
MHKKVNFSAGPSILPNEVFEKTAQAIQNFDGMDLSILEISHRSKEFVAVMDRANALAKEILAIPENYEVLFLSGGASSQFFMVPMNLLTPENKAGYLDTGTWSSKAIKEARLLGNAELLASSKESTYKHIPKNYNIPEDLRYLHITSNNTIYGTQIHEFPDTNVRLVADMSSDIFSRKIPVDRFDIIYAGAQKNLGPAGVTLVIINKDILPACNKNIPSMLRYDIHVDGESMYNTPPVLPIYSSMLTLEWIKNLGGLEEIERRNKEKADLLYAEIDRNSLFNGHAVREDRSRMNVCFTITQAELEKEFTDVCTAAGCSGLKGHRSVGGFRASIYNAMELDGVKTLTEIMKDFESRKG